MEASVAIQSLPAVADDDELCRIVDEVIAYIASSGYNYFVADGDRQRVPAHRNPGRRPRRGCICQDQLQAGR